MRRKISALSLAVYLSLTGFFKGLKKDERGLSGVVVAILLILIAVLAIVLIWGFLGGWLKDLWAQIVGESDKIQSNAT